MIISRTPFRVSFFGGGTDYPDWFREHGGAVLSTTIDKYCYISVRELPPFFDHRFRVVYSIVENVKEIGEIAHPAVRAVLDRFHAQKGLEIHHDGDLPARSGLGSSSAFTVGLISALHALGRRYVSQDAPRVEAIPPAHCRPGTPVGAAGARCSTSRRRSARGFTTRCAAASPSPSSSRAPARESSSISRMAYDVSASA